MPKVSQDYVENFGKVPTSPWMSGEQAHKTSAAINGAGNNTSLPLPNDVTYDEPSIVAPTRSMNTVVFSSKSGGNSFVVNDEGESGEGYMLITHRSGSVVQIDADGTVLIKSFGDTHNNTEGLHYQRSEGDTNQSIGGEWNVMVEGGSGNVYIQGDMNVEAENINFTARGKYTINAGEGVIMRGAKFQLESHSDNFDVLAKNIKFGSTETFSIKSGKDILFSTGTNFHVSSVDAFNLQAGTKINTIAGEQMLISTPAFDVLAEDSIKLGSGGTIDYGASGEIKVGAGGNLRLSGSNAYMYGGTTYIDNIVQLANGGASSVTASEPAEAGEASVATSPSFVELPDPPARRPATSSREGVTQVQPRTGSISSRNVDDTE